MLFPAQNAAARALLHTTRTHNERTSKTFCSWYAANSARHTLGGTSYELIRNSQQAAAFHVTCALPCLLSGYPQGPTPGGRSCACAAVTCRRESLLHSLQQIGSKLGGILSVCALLSTRLLLVQQCVLHWSHAACLVVIEGHEVAVALLLSVGAK